MRQILARGLAIAASLAWLSPAMAQLTDNPTTSRFDSNLSTLQWPNFRAAGFARGSNDQPSPAASARDVQEPPAATQAVPEPTSALQTPAAGTESASASDRASYFDSNCNSGPNWTVGVYGLIFRRDYEDDVGLSAIPSDLSQNLSSTSAETGTMGGVEAVIARRGSDGRGFEFRYWGLYPNESSANLDGSPSTNLSGLSEVEFGGFAVDEIYNGSDSHWVYRNNTINNFEFNLLHYIGSTNCGRSNWEWLAGFRYLSFDESLRYSTYSSGGTYPAELNYDNCTFNDLYGFQVGAQTERCLNCRLGLQFGTKVGIYNNYAQACQTINDGGPAFAEISSGPSAGSDYAFESTKNDAAMLGELNLGLTYQLGCNWRAVGGYRVVGISGVALAPDQIPNNYTDRDDIYRVDSNGSLILYGGYFGVERSF